jgi:hypothetical protein
MAPDIPKIRATPDWAPSKTAFESKSPRPRRAAATTDTNTKPVQIQLINTNNTPQIENIVSFVRVYAKIAINFALKIEKTRQNDKKLLTRLQNVAIINSLKKHSQGYSSVSQPL